jgi:hypothetical protein
LSLVVTGANRHDVSQMEAVLDAIVVEPAVAWRTSRAHCTRRTELARVGVVIRLFVVAGGAGDSEQGQGLPVARRKIECFKQRGSAQIERVQRLPGRRVQPCVLDLDEQGLAA